MTDPIAVLFVTESFPPDNRVGGKRIARFCRYLPEFGVKPIVLTVQERFFEGLDTSYLIPEGIELIRTRVTISPLEWYRRHKRLRKQQPEAAPGMMREPILNRQSGLRRLLEPLRSHLALLQVPNHSWGWYPHAVNAGAALLRGKPIAAIVSSGPPWTCHLVARKLKRRFGLPWIADFRDAWTSNPWRTELPSWSQKIEDRLEASFVREADRVISVVDAISDDFRWRYSDLPAGKFVTITNGFEGELQTTPNGDTHTRQTVLHLGSLYGDRRMENFCRAVAKLIHSGKISPQNVQIVFVGPIAPEFLATAQREIPELLREKVVEFRDRVPYDEGQRLLRSADVLLLLLGDNRHVITAKFYEYISTTVPLFVIAKKGALSRLVDETKVGTCADPDDVDAIAGQLLRALKLPRRTRSQAELLADRFHFRNLSRQLARLLEEVSERR